MKSHVQITGGGSMFLFVRLTDAARAWVDEHVSANQIERDATII